MTARTTWVPLHSIIVVRDEKQVDARAEYLRTGKAFKFTADEIEDIKSAHDGNLDAALRSPTEEGAEDDEAEVQAPAAPASSNEPTPEVPVEDKEPAPKAPAKAKAKAKDDDL